MTREEAIKRFQRMKKIFSIHNSDAARMIEAIDMAIEALNCNCSEKPNGSDIISRQDAIEAVRKVWCDNDDRNDFKQRYYEMGNNDAVEDAIGYIDALPSAEPKTGWIPVSERLPEIHDEVLVTTHGEVSIAWLYLDGEWRSNDMPQQMFKDIIAWMPLPEPYKGGEEE